MKNNKTDSILNELKGKHTFSNCIVLLFIILLLLIDFMPYFKSLEIINPQFLYLAFVNLIFGIYFYFKSDLVSDSLLLLKKSNIFKCYLLFLFLSAISFFSAKNISLVFTKITEISIVFCLFINLTILLKDKLDLFYKIVFIVGISAFLQSWQQLCHFVIIPKHASIIDLLNNMKGNTGNINILAASLTIKVPFLLLGVNHFKGYKKLFLIFALFSVTSVIFLTGARTSYINLFLIYFIYIVHNFKENPFKRNIVSSILFFTIPVLVAILLSNSIFQKSKDKSRYVSLGNRVSQINTEDASANARLVYWKNAITLIEKNPITGIGLGNYQIESIPYERTFSNDMVVSLHAHNDFLEITSETGVLNGLVYITLFVLLLIINFKNILFKKNNQNRKDVSLLALLLIIVYGIDSLLNFPMYRPTMQIFFGLILAFTVVNNLKKNNLELHQNGFFTKILCFGLIVVALATTCSSYIIYKASNLEYLIVSDDINSAKSNRFLTGDEVIKRMPAYPNVFNTSESFYEYAGIYYIREKKYEKALKCFSKALKINPYTGRIQFYKQTIASQRGNIDSAYIYSKQAFYLRPRNYDLYKSAMNYCVKKNDTIELLKEHNLFSHYRNVPESWISVALALQSFGAKPRRLIDFINQGLKKMPNDSVLLKQKNAFLIASYLQGGQDFETQSDLKNALKSFEKVLKIDPKNIYATQNIGFNYFKQGQNKKAISALIEALKYPELNDGKTEFFIGICYLKENDKPKALKYFNMSKSKNYLPAKQLITQFNSNNNLQTELKKQKNDLLIAGYITEGQKFEEQKKFSEALKSYEKALKIDPKSIYAAQNIGFYYLKIGNSKKAINYLLNALKYPGLNDGKTEYFLAVCYLQQNDKTNACKYLSISKNKNYANADQLMEKFCK